MRADEKWMLIAIEEAKLAAEAGEVPVGAVIVRDGALVARAHNLCEQKGMATAHAELLAIEAACQALGCWRLSDCTLYVTLEPCSMCAGAVVNARLPRVVYGAKDPRMGACGSLLDLSAYPLECRPKWESGVLEEESLDLLRRFFSKMREKRKNN